MDSYDEMDVSSDRDNSVDTVDSCHLEGRQFRQILSAKRPSLGASDNRPRKPEDIQLRSGNEMPLSHHFPSPFFNNNNHHHNILDLSPIQSPSSTFRNMMHSSGSWYTHNSWSSGGYNASLVASFSPYGRLPTNRNSNISVKRDKDGSQKFDEDWGQTLSEYYEEEGDKKETDTNMKKKRIAQ